MTTHGYPGALGRAFSIARICNVRWTGAARLKSCPSRSHSASGRSSRGGNSLPGHWLCRRTAGPSTALPCAIAHGNFAQDDRVNWSSDWSSSLSLAGSAMVLSSGYFSISVRGA